MMHSDQSIHQQSASSNANINQRACSLVTTILTLFFLLTNSVLAKYNPTENQIPSQFIAKIYTEMLGRAPDAPGWQNLTNYFSHVGCSRDTLSTAVSNVLQSKEFLDHGFSERESLLIAYRTVLSRDPDPNGFEFHLDHLVSGNLNLAQIVEGFFGSPEFGSLISDICSADGYRSDWGNSQAIDIGRGTWSQDRLQTCLDNNTVCNLPEGVVVYITDTLTIPEAHTLQTAGNPDPTEYSRQARIVRNSGNFQRMIEMMPGSKLKNVWVSGQRHLFREVATDLNQSSPNVFYGSGTGGIISGTRLDFPYQRPLIETSGSDCSMTIAHNLLVGYTSSHSPDGTQTWISDGIANHCANATIHDNHIVDPTDVGIVIFGWDNFTQTSKAYANTIVHAGLSAYGSLVFDTTSGIHDTIDENGVPNDSVGCSNCSFEGSVMRDNLIIAGQGQHIDFMLSIGTTPWAAHCDDLAHVPCSAQYREDAFIGHGAEMINNRTIWGDELQRVSTSVAILVDGMVDANTEGNGLYVGMHDPYLCSTEGNHDLVINHTSHVPNHASGTLIPGADKAMHRCQIPH